MNKQELRKEIRRRKQSFSDEQLSIKSLPIIEKLSARINELGAKNIIMYYSLPDEVDTHHAIDLLLKDNANIYLPKVTGEGTMEIRRYEGKESMREGAFGIMEPCGGVLHRYEDIDLIVVPGMAFDKNFNRLGRGKGYYDRFLAKTTNKKKIGICFDFQVVDSIPTEETDIRMDELIYQ